MRKWLLLGPRQVRYTRAVSPTRGPSHNPPATSVLPLVSVSMPRGTVHPEPCSLDHTTLFYFRGVNTLVKMFLSDVCPVMYFPHINSNIVP